MIDAAELAQAMRISLEEAVKLQESLGMTQPKPYVHSFAKKKQPKVETIRFRSIGTKSRVKRQRARKGGA